MNYAFWSVYLGIYGGSSATEQVSDADVAVDRPVVHYSAFGRKVVHYSALERRLMADGDYTIREGESVKLPMQCLNEAGEPMSSTLVSSITLDLYWKDSDGDANIINNREGTDVNGANGGTYQSDLTITGATKTDPVVITAASHGLLSGDKVLITSVGGMTEINDTVWRITRLTDGTFSLNGSNGSSYTTYTTGGIARSGLFTWQTAAADNAIQNTSLAIGNSEEHVAEFTFTFTDAMILVNEYKYRVVKLGG